MAKFTRLLVQIGLVQMCLVLLISILSTSWVYASAKPTHALLFGWSDVVVVGRLHKVSNSKEGFKVFVDVRKFVRASYAVRNMKRLSFFYPRFEGRNLDFSRMQRDGGEYLIFLRIDPESGGSSSKVAAFHLQLTDAWFGIEKADPRITNQLTEFEQKLFGFIQTDE